jgi:hypothetical protein
VSVGIRKPPSLSKKSRKDPPAPSPRALPAWLQHTAFADEEVRLYLVAAARCGLEVSHWARNTLNAAARAILEIEDDL